MQEAPEEAEVAHFYLEDPVVLSKAIVEYMNACVVNDGLERQVIYGYNEDGWILVGNSGDFEEGDGVWVDDKGNEHYPGGGY